MPHFDYGGQQLRAYRPDLTVPQDLDRFWEEALSRPATTPARFEPVDNHLQTIDSYDVTFAGGDGHPVKGWLHLPAGTREPLPTVVQYIGYGGGRGLSHEGVLWAAAGYAQLVMDTRGQGSSHRVGDTSDLGAAGAPAHPGFMTQGIASPETYYYRRVFVDAVRAVDAAIAHPLVDAGQIVVAGGSQGGGLAIAAASLHEAVRFALIDVPFLCDFPRATSVAPRDPYTEIVRYLKVHRERVEDVFRTLSYFDGAVLGRKATAEALFSVALMDDICPPSTVYAAYNWYGGAKAIVEYPYNNHEGGQAQQEQVQLRWLAERVGFPG